jgi:hypothetical protein
MEKEEKDLEENQEPDATEEEAQEEAPVEEPEAVEEEEIIEVEGGDADLELMVELESKIAALTSVINEMRAAIDQIRDALFDRALDEPVSDSPNDEYDDGTVRFDDVFGRL